MNGMVEKQGFEPWEGINPQRFSRPPLSATQPPLRKTGIIRNFEENEKSFMQK